jgi:phospholipid/cholesterol/gamma-HCH transport system substrate-binding protein
VKKKDMDLIVGASILVAVVILIGGVLWLKEVSVSRKMVDYAVLFPNVGTLQVGDPVMINGVSKGAVKKIYLRGIDVAVILEVERNVRITDSCRIMIQNIGLMGERGVGLQYSESGNQFHPIRGNDTTFLYGSFDTGIAEAMGMLGSVLSEVQVLAGNVAAIVEQTIGDTSFISLFRSILARLDTITAEAQDIIHDNKGSINRSVVNLRTLSEEAKLLIERNSPVFDSIAADGKALSSRALLIADNVDSLTVSARALIVQIQDEEGTVGKILHDEKLYDDLKRTVADLDTLVTSVQNDALKLRIKFGFGKKRNK